MKTILALLLADRAVKGDVYRAYNTNWSVSHSGALESGDAYLCVDTMGLISAEGWARVISAIPLPLRRFECETVVLRERDGGCINTSIAINWPIGRRVKLTVEELS